MKTSLLKLMIRCSLPLSLLAVFSGCSKNEGAVRGALDGEIAAPVTDNRPMEPAIMGKIVVPEVKK